MIEYFYKLIMVPVNQSILYKINQTSKKCNIINIIDDNNIKLFDFDVKSKIKMEMFSSGYLQCGNYFKNLN